MPIVELFGVDDAARLRAALALRIEVFCGEQRVPLDEEIDDHDRDDAAAVHALAIENGEAVGAGRFYEREPHCVQIGRMAVRAPMRSRGVGHAILRALVQEARRRGHAHAVLYAQTHALDFYRKAGFVEYGAPFDDAGIPHLAMRAELRNLMP